MTDKEARERAASNEVGKSRAMLWTRAVLDEADDRPQEVESRAIRTREVGDHEDPARAENA